MTNTVGRLRARARITTGRVLIEALAAAGDPVGRLLRPGRRDVYAVYEDIRARGPVTRSVTGTYLVTSHELCSQVLRDPRFRVRDLQNRPADADVFAPDAAGPLGESFLEQDPPDHTRLRRLVAPAFRPARIRAWRPRVESLTAELVDRAAAREEFDLVTDIATPLPITVISELLGIPEQHTERFARIGQVVGESLGGVSSPARADALRAARDDLAALFVDLDRRRAAEPTDDVLGLLAAARAEDRLTLDELVATAALLLVAGFETTVNLVGNAVAALGEHPEQWDLLRTRPELAAAAVEETLRFDPPVQATVRIPHEPVELGGDELAPGTVVYTLLAAAHRDPDVYAEPHRFDLTRVGEPDHLAFSSGIHYCLGAALARLEGEVALRTLAERLPRLRLTGTPQRRRGSVIRGFARLPVAIR